MDPETTATEPKAGLRFTHASFLEPTWTPETGQRVSDGPNAAMVITKVDTHTTPGQPFTKGVWLDWPVPA
jgi:hypothetical protein